MQVNKGLCTRTSRCAYAKTGGETYLKSEDWDGNENWRNRQTDSTAIQIEVMHSSAGGGGRGGGGLGPKNLRTKNGPTRFSQR